MKQNIPNIYEYNNFRNFLADYQSARQKSEKKFNKSNFSKLLGLPNTRSYFIGVLKGRKITPNFAERFIQIIDFNDDEAQYFRVLVKFNQAENPNERDIYFEQLISLNKTPKRILQKEIFEYYKHWYNSAIRAILNIYDFSGDYVELSHKIFPKITPKQAKKSIELLLKLNLIKKNEQNQFVVTENSISAPEYIKNDLIEQYQLKCLDLAKTAIVTNKFLPQTVSTNTISISKEGYKRLEKKIHTFRSEVRSLVHRDENKAEQLYQLNIQLFPNSK